LQQLDCSEPLPRIAYATIGQALKRIFQQNMNIRPAALDAANAGEQQRAKTLLFSIAPEMLEMLLLQFGNLGFNVEEHRPRFCATCHSTNYKREHI
jgi:hypothetical protein